MPLGVVGDRDSPTDTLRTITIFTQTSDCISREITMSQIIESIKNEEAQKEEKKQEEIRIYKNTSRLVGNALEIIADSEFSGREVFAVAEVIQWLTSMKQQVRQELSDRGVDESSVKKEDSVDSSPKS